MSEVNPNRRAPRTARRAPRVNYGRPPKTNDTDRWCEVDECTVKLSRYNTNPTCWTHTPRTRKRVRGKPST